jgi:heme exporter protein D
MTEILEMGGYASFVWSSFAVTAVVMVWVAVSSWRTVGLNQKVLNDLEARLPRRRGRRTGSSE